MKNQMQKLTRMALAIASALAVQNASALTPARSFLPGTYIYQDRGLTFTLHLSYDMIAYPLASGETTVREATSVPPNICGVNTSGAGYCHPIGIDPIHGGGFIASLNADNCHGWAGVRVVNDSRAIGSGRIEVADFSIYEVLAQPMEISTVSNQTVIPGYDVRARKQCRSAQKAARLLENAVRFSVNSYGLNLRLKGGRILKLQRIDWKIGTSPGVSVEGQPGEVQQVEVTGGTTN